MTARGTARQNLLVAFTLQFPRDSISVFVRRPAAQTSRPLSPLLSFSSSSRPKMHLLKSQRSEGERRWSPSIKRRWRGGGGGNGCTKKTALRQHRPTQLLSDEGVSSVLKFPLFVSSHSLLHRVEAEARLITTWSGRRGDAHPHKRSTTRGGYSFTLLPGRRRLPRDLRRRPSQCN